jgi:zinc-ribbon domain
MRKRLLILFLLGLLAFPFSARAQESLKLTTLQVQLWPEYDQPSMLVIYDFKLPDGIKLPASISMGMPKDATLEAVASLSTDGGYINTDFVGPTVDTDRQVVTIQIQKPVMYHLEYYEPITKSGGRRDFTYLWAGDYPVDDLTVSVRVPVDTNNIITNPIMKSAQNADGADILIKDFGSWAEGQQFVLQVNYTKTTDNLTVSQPSVQPSQPVGSNTPGRLVLANYLPYVFGGLGLALIMGGMVFFWQSSRAGKPHGRKRSHSKSGNEHESGVYCSQCGARARLGDRFCRVCGTKLRLAE